MSCYTGRMALSPCCHVNGTLLEIVSAGQTPRANLHRGEGQAVAQSYAEHVCRSCGAHWRTSWTLRAAKGYGVRVVMGPPLAAATSRRPSRGPS